MLLTMLKSKLHRATVTGADLDYEGSIAIDRDLLDFSGILPRERVDVFNINTGGRFTTYAIETPRGSRDVAVNGAAARLVQTGDKVIIVAYCQIPAEEARNYHPTVVVLGEGQRGQACGLRLIRSEARRLGSSAKRAARGSSRRTRRPVPPRPARSGRDSARARSATRPRWT